MIAILEIAAIAAGLAIMQVYSRGPQVSIKPDLSPVTDADEKAEAIILACLGKEFPDIPVIAEESAAAGILPDPHGQPFFLVDPLDGTKEFLLRNGEFTVNIALIRDEAPIAGIVHAPALGIAYTGSGDRAERLDIDSAGNITGRTEIHARVPGRDLIAVASRSHDCENTRDFLANTALEKTTRIGSALKFGLLAEGKADIYPRFTPTMEWDTAAGDAVLRAAGGMTLNLLGHPMRYGLPGANGIASYLNAGFVAHGAAKR